VVKFISFFEDKTYVYLMLELCDNQSMLRLLKKRRNISEAEARFYLIQLVEGLKYLKKHRIIHRDLKLGNLFLNDDLHCKIGRCKVTNIYRSKVATFHSCCLTSYTIVGDFGLATKLETDDERRKTICGTPNYIAPEILLGGEGHSYEVDVWSLGVIM
jgi:serine/threonine protein kinase